MIENGIKFFHKGSFEILLITGLKINLMRSFFEGLLIFFNSLSLLLLFHFQKYVTFKVN